MFVRFHHYYFYKSPMLHYVQRPGVWCKRDPNREVWGLSSAAWMRIRGFTKDTYPPWKLTNDKLEKHNQLKM